MTAEEVERAFRVDTSELVAIETAKRAVCIEKMLLKQ
jgi:hypothetical protein